MLKVLVYTGTSVWYAKVNAALGFLITQTKPEESSYRLFRQKNIRTSNHQFILK